MKTPYLLLGLFACALSLPALAADKVYKWKDANGITHFTDQPPPKGTEFDNVQVKAAPVADAGKAGTDAKLMNSSDPNATADAAAANPDKQRCEEARVRVSQLSGPGDIAMLDASGKSVRINKESRANELAVANTQVQAYCGTPAK